MSGKLIVLSGPGGVGKSTIVSELKKIPDFFFSVSATTREPRSGEINGVAYNFVSDEQFDQMIEENRFLEWATFAGARYGTPSEPVDKALKLNRNVLLEIEIEGARQVRKLRPDAMLVFLKPPDFQALEKRIRGRATESEERIRARLELAHEEMAAASEFDEVITNHRVEEVVKALVALATR
jgi:guanylate kinase